MNETHDHLAFMAKVMARVDVILESEQVRDPRFCVVCAKRGGMLIEMAMMQEWIAEDPSDDEARTALLFLSEALRGVGHGLVQ